MITPHILILISWTVFICYWAISAINTKKEVKQNNWWSGRAYEARLVLLLVIFLFVVSQLTRKGGFTFLNKLFESNGYPFGNTVATIGAVLCMIGIGFAVWARIYLGRNWSSHPAEKIDHELVTSGPYKFVRHPIYTGMLLALFGTFLTVGFIWAIPLSFGSFVFIRRIGTEEKIMMKLFPDKYPAYKKKTKALIPFVI